MKYKVVALTIVFFLIIGSFSAVSGEDSDEEKIFERITLTEPALFSTTSFESQGEYLKISLDKAEHFTSTSGEPMLPVIIKSYTFPHGTKIKNVEVTTSGLTKEKIEGKILPAPIAVPVTNLKIKKTDDQSNDFDIYSSSNLYPENEFDYYITSGMNGLYLSIHIYPYRYIPAEDTIYSVDQIDIEIDFEKSTFTPTFEEEFDMVIIAPEEFSDLLQPLIDHKNDLDIETFLKTTEDIYDEYPGRDEPEQIKYYIKDAKETYNITYVLLVGGMKGIHKEWYVPVRETNVDDFWECHVISDLYYADIYKYNETTMEKEFEDWDENNNSEFAEWYGPGRWRKDKPEGVKDEIDLVPDVSVGRLACRSKSEVRTVVNKIITYETMNHNPFWSKKMIVVGGDTVPNPADYYEGEIETTASSDLMKDSDYVDRVQKLYVSDGTLRNFGKPFNVVRAMRGGAGFVHFAGHGNPREWATHPPNSDDETWIIGLDVYQMPLIMNGNRLPIVVVGGCHNSQFNVTPLNLLNMFTDDRYFNTSRERPGGFWRLEYIRECWSWKLLSIKNGGAIAVIGNTGIGYGWGGPACVDGVGGWIEIRFFDLIANQGKKTMGEAHAQAITDYVNIIGGVNTDITDRKTVDGWALLGDPSLKIGGYSE
jgi:hypothetical protein